MLMFASSSSFGACSLTPRPPRRRCRLLHVRTFLLLFVVFFAVAIAASDASVYLPTFAKAADASSKTQPGFFRRIGRRVKDFLTWRGEKGRVGGLSTAVSPTGIGGVRPGSGSSHVPLGPSSSDLRGGRGGDIGSGGGDGGVGNLHHLGGGGRGGRSAPADPAKAVWHSLGLPHFRSSKVQDVLEYWHIEASGNLLDSFHLQELLRSYLTVLDWAGQLFTPDLADDLRIYTNDIISTVLDVDVCSKRLLYLSGIPIVAGRGSHGTDIETRKTKAVHTLGVYYVLRGRLLQLSSLVRESSKFFCKELTKRHNFTAQMARVLMPFSRLARYSLDSLEYLLEYYKELTAAIIGSVVYPLLVTRTYSRLHRSLQTAGQFFAACVHAHKIGVSLQHEIAEIRGLGGVVLPAPSA